MNAPRIYIAKNDTRAFQCQDPFYVGMNVCETSVGCILANRNYWMCLTAVRSRTSRFCLEILTRQKGCGGLLGGGGQKMSMVLT